MPDPTYIACPRCGEPMPMTAMQKRLYIGRTVSCQRCAKPFAITEETPDPVPAVPSTPRAWQSAQERPVAAVATEPSEPQAQLPPRKAGAGLTAGRMAVLIVVGGGLVAYLLYLAVSPSVHRAREASRRASCSTNLMQIGSSLLLHANRNGGRFPDALEDLVANGTLPAELLICPSAHDHTPAPGQSSLEQAANLAKGKHQSYVYAGKGQTYRMTKQVLVYEPLELHDGQGVNVLYNDMTVQFLPRAAAMTAIPALAPTPTGASSTQPATTRASP
jgi:hypothetical protein